VGQVVSARAALKLLAHRASMPDKVWPEFAEYDCFACHHALREKSTRPGSTGAAPWGEWYYSMLPALTKPSADHEALTELRKEMARPAPRKEMVIRLARTAVDELEASLEKHSRAGIDRVSALQRMGKLLDGSAGQEASRNWDRATQLYLGLAAHEASLGDRNLRAPLLNLRQPLLLPPGFESPKCYDATTIRAALEELHRQVDK
jgi:hypothetical protein